VRFSPSLIIASQLQIQNQVSALNPIALVFFIELLDFFEKF